MPYATPRPKLCSCGRTFTTSANRALTCDDCRAAKRQRQKARADKQRAAQAKRKKIATAHPDSLMAWLLTHGEDDEWYEPPNQPEPVEAAPGSQEKIDAMTDRFLYGMPLFCDGDRSGTES